MHAILEHLRTNKDAYLVLVPCMSVLFAFIAFIATNMLAIRAERRNAFRKSIENDLKELGAVVYQILALIDVYRHKRTDESERNWKIKMYKAKERLSALRPLVRYSLPGIDPGLKALVRSIDWITHIKDYNKDASTKLVNLADAVRCIIDDIAIESYAKGIHPKKKRLVSLFNSVNELRMHYYETMNDKRSDNESIELEINHSTKNETKPRLYALLNWLYPFIDQKIGPKKLLDSIFASNSLTDSIFSIVRNMTYSAVGLWAGDYIGSVVSHNKTIGLIFWFSGRLVLYTSIALMSMTYFNGLQRIKALNLKSGYRYFAYSVASVFVLMVGISIIMKQFGK
jgi:ABC-type multidrug transport system fused ATPase/permease subunit